MPYNQAVVEGETLWVVDAFKEPRPRLYARPAERLAAFQELQRLTKQADSVSGVGRH
jgi:hypothetical protein